MKNVTGILGFQLKTENIGSILPKKVIFSLPNDVFFRGKAFELLLTRKYPLRGYCLAPLRGEGGRDNVVE